jgi:hypothetical protein
MVVLAATWLTWRYPRINDVTTDLDDPPEIPGAPYPRERFAAVQREAYGDLTALVVQMTPAAAFAAALAAARELGWEIVHRDASRRAFRAVDRTTVFRFVDDIAVRVATHPQGARVDTRSRSRIGRGDVGANARRIRRFQQQLARVARE